LTGKKKRKVEMGKKVEKEETGGREGEGGWKRGDKGRGKGPLIGWLENGAEGSRMANGDWVAVPFLGE
jgi:hypothetical protein